MSGVNKTTPDGLHGNKSSLFFFYLHLLQRIPRDGGFVFENVASMSANDKAEITEALSKVCISKGWSLHCTEVCNSSWAPMLRPRLFWTNFPVPPPPLPKANARVHDWLDPTNPGELYDADKVDKYMGKTWGSGTRWRSGGYLDMGRHFVAPTLVAHAARGLPCNLIVHARTVGQTDGVYRKWAVPDAEALLGFPKGWTEPMGSYSARMRGLGNTMSVFAMRHILQAAADARGSKGVPPLVQRTLASWLKRKRD